MIDILVVEDTPESQEFIRRILSTEYIMHLADTGEKGLADARAIKPDAIILDVDLPGIDGYEVCRQLKGDAETRDIPIVFLSAHSDLEQRMQGFEAGGDDYLVKPCDPKTLRAKMKVVLRYRDQVQELEQQYKTASHVAHIAMSGSSELGMAMQFVNNSYAIHDYGELARSLFSMADTLGYNCSLMFCVNNEPLFFSAKGLVSPLEQELLERLHREKRIFDFGQRTVFNYPSVSLLVKNMPLDDKERYGRIKDLFPLILASMNDRIFSLGAETHMNQQSSELTHAFSDIKTSLLSLSETLTNNQKQSITVMRNMMLGLNDFLPRLGLEEDQENSILNHIEGAVERSNQLTDAYAITESTFQDVIIAMEQLLLKQTRFMADMLKAQYSTSDSAISSQAVSNTDLF